MVHESNSKRLLLIIGWVNVIAALLLFQAFCGLMAICMGIVLKKDYQAPTHGLVLIVVGIFSTVIGWLLNHFYM
ncbi:hypothetical protein M5J14_00385 [Lysinibacillus sp. OL1_EC]|uniref:hypothetical protein n=1 Tax=unclassified Lysinibacillus TaxID=2636778 RepID=UPI00103C560F|nr:MULTISPECIES: hypothetical protein [unclassified Lysinibacillus]MCM0622973.1 hypothetical protein [Lysinibacillus sp. OL1_EC]TBV90096.1 hypothetical protein EW028_03975 [Lysinibacillus sp. OL1]WGT41544.1 hypothetical protein QH639_12420 [Lysinibacillus sp. 1 U-2021]